MKRIIVYLYAVAFFMSCSDSLDLVPKDKFSDEIFWKTSADLEVSTDYKLI